MAGAWPSLELEGMKLRCLSECHYLLPAPHSHPCAGAVVSPLQKARMCSLCRPLHPDVPVMVREALLLHGLLPDDLGGQCGMSLRGGAAPAALGAGQARLPIEQAQQP